MCPASTTETSLTLARAELARKRGTGTAEAVENARREHYAAKLERYVADVVAKAPELTVDQKARIAALLRPASGGPDVAA